MPSSGFTVSLPNRTNTITIQSLNDSLVEGNEDFQLEASNPTGAFEFAGGGTIGTGTGTILDNDSRVLLTIEDGRQIEGDQGYSPAQLLSFNIKATVQGKPLDRPITVSLQTQAVSPIVNGLPNPKYATPIADYQPVAAQVVLQPGNPNATFNVPINGDWIVEDDEEFYGVITGFSVGAPTNPNSLNSVEVVLSRSQAVGTILDDDKPKAQALEFDFIREYDEKISCVCDTAPTADQVLVSNVDGALTYRPDFEPMIVLQKGGNFDTSQLQTITIIQKAGKTVPDRYKISFTVGTLEVSSQVVNAIGGEDRKSVV